MKKNRGILTSLIGLAIGYTSDEDIIRFLERFLSNFREPDDTIEVFYTLTDLGKNKFTKILGELKYILAPRVGHLGNKIKILLPYMSQSCRDCFIAFVNTLRKEIISSLSKQHFNDIITLLLNIALIDEDTAVFFAESIGDLIVSLAKTEGIKHFGTILWYTVLLKKKILAQKLISILHDLIIMKAFRLSDYGDLILWLGKGELEMGLHVYKIFKEHIFDKIKHTNISDLIIFMVQISKIPEIGKSISKEIAPMVQQRISKIENNKQMSTLLMRLSKKYKILRLIINS